MLSKPVLLELGACIDALRPIHPGRPHPLGKASGFIAGADINEFVTFTNVDEAFELIREARRCWNASRPALPHGGRHQRFTLGGGLELALACGYRVAADDDKVSLGSRR